MIDLVPIYAPISYRQNDVCRVEPPLLHLGNLRALRLSEQTRLGQLNLNHAQRECLLMYRGQFELDSSLGYRRPSSKVVFYYRDVNNPAILP